MKKIKVQNFLSFLVLGVIGSGLVFSLSSKDPLDDDPNTSNCGDPSLTAEIQINFNPSTSFDFARETNFQGFVPSPDLRFGDPSGMGGFLSQYNKYYCSVTVTSPDCENFMWEGVLDASNSNGSGRMTIQAPPTLNSTTIQISYYETADAPNNPFDFNVGNNPIDSKRLRYTYTETFQGSLGDANVPQPIQLEPFMLVRPNGDANTGKNSAAEDYESINEFLNQ